MKFLYFAVYFSSEKDRYFNMITYDDSDDSICKAYLIYSNFYYNFTSKFKHFLVEISSTFYGILCKFVTLCSVENIIDILVLQVCD